MGLLQIRIWKSQLRVLAWERQFSPFDIILIVDLEDFVGKIAYAFDFMFTAFNWRIKRSGGWQHRRS